ncbi:GNAT family N-acetyltransferase [Streptomyces sp. GC420]|uniref:GNAT family N-acetyltransferase n=1 Tax=Streptomyces sp. GC420 TaxID=2697568 RepID=UPI001414EF9E|nr:GNAT family N-acetyltransferase [Streptomyces sp. GC420]NBM20296.1 GNAT family N-acetyltransferase [Streptomyces sp. GC420]
MSRLSGPEFRDALAELGELLADTVDGGASVGFLAPFKSAEAADWWETLAPDVEAGRLLVWAARDTATGRLVGTVSLVPAGKPNARHRAEIAKLMVHREARGRGLGRELLAVAERAAAEAGMTLLLLDTETDSPAEGLYRSAGWTPFGTVPGHAALPSGELRPTTYFRKNLGSPGI